MYVCICMGVYVCERKKRERERERERAQNVHLGQRMKFVEVFSFHHQCSKDQTKIVSYLVLLLCFSETPQTRATLGEKGLFGLSFYITVHH